MLSRVLSRLWPDTLFGRLAMIWALALLVGHVIEVAASYTTVLDYQTTRTEYYLAKDLGLLVPMLEQAAPAEREAWLKRMNRQSYRFALGNFPDESAQNPSPRAKLLVAAVERELGSSYHVQADTSGRRGADTTLHLHLKDGTALSATLIPVSLGLPWWGGAVFVMQASVLILFTWIAVRQTTRPLVRLAEEAEALGSSFKCAPVVESGPSEVVRAAAAFNAMQRRITEHLDERTHILASISHDLQTPITRMRLRADLMDSGPLRDKLHGDLNAMQVLVEEGIAYARSAHSVNEAPCRVDIDALLDSLVCDYVDDGRHLTLTGKIQRVVTTRPHALRRIVANLVDNALKFGEQVEIAVTLPAPDVLAIEVLDRGPGIPPQELEAVLKPFYRLEASRNRGSGGTGLGLAIAQQMVTSLGGTLRLSNRDGGGLQSVISLPI